MATVTPYKTLFFKEGTRYFKSTPFVTFDITGTTFNGYTQAGLNQVQHNLGTVLVSGGVMTIHSTDGVELGQLSNPAAVSLVCNGWAKPI